MAWVQSRSGRWRVLFRHAGKIYTFWLGDVSRQEAEATAGKVDYWLMRLKQNIVSLPPGCDIVTFVQNDGRPPQHPVSQEFPSLTLGALRQAFLTTRQSILEETTLAGMRLHFAHLVRILGENRLIHELTRPDLQAYVHARGKDWIDPNVFRRQRRTRDATRKPRKNRKPPPSETEDRPRRHPSAATIRKELVTLRSAWNWARRNLGLTSEFPGDGIEFPKTKEALPYMTWDDALRRVKAGGDPTEVWESVYLRSHEVSELLIWLESRPVSPWVHPMICFAAHTGARRSEIVRVTPADLNLSEAYVTIREKKRDRKRLTTRRVPLSDFLRQVLIKWMETRQTGKTLFCRGKGEPISPAELTNYFRRAFRLSKWKVLKGLHVFRHSFVSALASRGVDQRVIDDLVGHCTEQQRRRYRHLYPDVTRKAIADVFDGSSSLSNDRKMQE